MFQLEITTQTITVVNIVSPSFTGTTWFNLILGCHDRAFAIGPLDHFWLNRTEGVANACQIHGEKCSFWPEFDKTFTASKNLFLQLAQATGKDYFIINNPQKSRVELEHPNITEKTIILLRDGRAVTASFHRKYPTHYTESAEDNFYHVVRDWWTPAINYFGGRIDQPNTLFVRYEDLMDDLNPEIETIGEFLGIQYKDNIDRYWEYEHHMAGGNGGPIYMAAKFQGYAHPGDQGNDSWYGFYRKELKRIEHGEKFKDERWQQELSRQDRYIFDYFAGELNEKTGYDRDRFTLPEHNTFAEELDQRLNPQPHDEVAQQGSPPPSAPPTSETSRSIVVMGIIGYLLSIIVVWFLARIL